MAQSFNSELNSELKSSSAFAHDLISNHVWVFFVWVFFILKFNEFSGNQNFSALSSSCFVKKSLKIYPKHNEISLPKT